MRHKNWKTYLKIACSWILIFSICFMNLETVSASEDETSVVTEQEETQVRQMHNRQKPSKLRSNLHQKQKLRHRQKLRNRFRIA